MFYGDDSFEFPLLGWSAEAVQGIVEGLESGDWSGWEEALQSIPRPDIEEAEPSERLQSIRYGRLWRHWARFWVLVAAILGFLLWGLQGAGAVELGSGSGNCISVRPVASPFWNTMPS